MQAHHYNNLLKDSENLIDAKASKFWKTLAHVDFLRFLDGLVIAAQHDVAARMHLLQCALSHIEPQPVHQPPACDSFSVKVRYHRSSTFYASWIANAD